MHHVCLFLSGSFLGSQRLLALDQANWLESTSTCKSVALNWPVKPVSVILYSSQLTCRNQWASAVWSGHLPQGRRRPKAFLTLLQLHKANDLVGGPSEGTVFITPMSYGAMDLENIRQNLSGLKTVPVWQGHTWTASSTCNAVFPSSSVTTDGQAGMLFPQQTLPLAS